MSTPIRVLMVEDSEDDALLIARELQRGGYAPDLMRVDSAEAMRAALDETKWDLVICDYSMPHFSGQAALELLRETGSEAPFIFVSGTIGEDTAVAALKQGAQDYVMKGNLRRLITSIRRELMELEQRRKRRELEREVQRLQRFEAIGRLAGRIAHDFNNALGVIAGWAQLGYEKAPAGSAFRENFQKIQDQAKRSAGLTAQLLAFARRQVLQPKSLSLNSLISDTTGILRSVIGEQIELAVSPDAEADVIHADATQIEQVLMNLTLNARDAMSKGGRLLIKTENIETKEESGRVHVGVKPGRYVLLSVSDTGTGMDAATMENLFQPFFTTKETGKGTGLGLATVYGIVTQHAGFVNVSTELGQGTTFRVYFPLSSGMPEKRALPANLKAAGGTETILVADDHEGIREVVRATLEARGYQIILAPDGQEAVRIFSQHRERIDLVLLDVVMPKLRGPDAYSKMCSIRPNMPVIFTTGNTAELVSLDSTIGPTVDFLKKPYEPEELIRAVRSKLEKSGAD